MPAERSPLTYTIAEAAERLGIHRQTLAAAVRRGEVPVVRIGPRRTLVPRAWLDRILDEGTPDADLTREEGR